MKRYSASGLKQYKACKLKYDLYYNQEIKIERPVTSDTVFGLLIHEIAENFDGKNFKQILEIVNKHKPNLTPDFISLLPQTIDNMMAWLKKHSTPSVNEAELELKTDEYWLYGLADKLFIEDKVFVDYKTAKSNFRENHIFQMKLYNMILSKKWECDPKEIKCIIYYPRIDEEDKILFNNTEIKLFEKEIKNIILDIETNKTWKPTESYGCRWCEYKEAHCPIWKVKNGNKS